MSQSPTIWQIGDDDSDIPPGLPSMAEVYAGAAQRRRLTAERLRQSKPWPAEKPDPELERVRQKWPDGERLATAWRLARDVEACADLIADKAVSQGRLDPDALLEAHRRTLVQFRAPIELLNVTEEAA